MFLAAKVWYVLQVLHCSRINIQRIHRVFAVFIWSSVWEKTSRTNLFRRVSVGGLGLSHLFVRQLVSRFIFLRDQKDPFLRTVIQTRLHSFLPGFIVSSNVTVSGCVRGYLKEVIGAYQFLTTRFSLDYLCGVTRKRLTKDVIDIIFPTPLYRMLYSEGPGQDVLKRVKRMFIPAHIKTFFFKLHSQTLPVKAWLAEKGVPIAWTDNCILCKKRETIEHVFLYCWDAVFFWDVLQRTLRKDLPLTPQGIRFLPVEEDEGVPLDTIMLLGLHSLWLCRLAVRHADIDVRPVHRYFVEHVCFMRELYMAQQTRPEWLPLLEELANLKDF